MMGVRDRERAPLLRGAAPPARRKTLPPITQRKLPAAEQWRLVNFLAFRVPAKGLAACSSPDLNQAIACRASEIASFAPTSVKFWMDHSRPNVSALAGWR
jgi:hypothetical protein